MSEPNTGRGMNLKAAANFLGIPLWRMRCLVWDRKIPCVKLGQRRILVDRDDLDKLISEAKEML